MRSTELTNRSVMENSTYIALSGENARQQQMDVLSNNIANMSTPGFKAERTMFQEHMVKAQNGQNAGGSDFVDIIGNARDMSQGPISQTGNPLDVALNGEGFIPVTTPNGTEYTRDGHLSMDAQGELTTSTGLVLQGDGGAPIVVPSGSGQITHRPRRHHLHPAGHGRQVLCRELRQPAGHERVAGRPLHHRPDRDAGYRHHCRARIDRRSERSADPTR